MKASAALIQTLGITERELEALLQRFNDSPDETSSRRHARTPYFVPGGVVVEVLNQREPLSCVYVAPRDISAGGIGVLHRGPLPGGTPVALHLPFSDRDIRLVRGQVVRCYGITHDVYDVGVAFDENIDVEPLVSQSAGGASA